MRRHSSSSIKALAILLALATAPPSLSGEASAQAPSAAREATRRATRAAAQVGAADDDHDHDHGAQDGPDDIDDEDDLSTTRGRRRARRRYDYSRFSDGPRRVPTARGASLERAQSLDLGTRQVADRLLHGRPEARWVDAAPGEVGDHLLWPVEEGRFGRGFGFVRTTRPDKRHDGVDVVAAEGTTVRAVADGIVAYSDNGVRGFGNFLIIVHPNGWVSTYAHLYRITVPAGYRVTAGERVGFVGNTGISRGPHLHFELHVDGHAVNPLPHFDGRPWVDAYRTWQRALANGTYREPTEHLTLPGSSRDPSGANARSARATTPTPAPTPRPTRPASDDPATIARALLDEPAPSSLRESAAEGRLFRNVLWPLRGGDVRRRYTRPRRGLDLRADSGTAVRAGSDGLVVYAGPLRGLGDVVVLLHTNGWVSLYSRLGETNVEIGQPIQRGEWIGATGRRPLHYRLIIEGDVVDPSEHIVNAPESVSL